jgi:Uma2 family endonuclease
MPLLYEDDQEGDMGESNLHEITNGILRIGLEAHFAGKPQYRVFSNLNLYYSPHDPKAYVSPDAMIVVPFAPLGADPKSYRIGKDGPAPILTAEILSERSAQQKDLEEKVAVYALLGVAEYILVDTSGTYLPQRLLLKRLQTDKSWEDIQDPDGGITSQLGFRLVIDVDNQLRVLDLGTGRRYVRPNEAEAEAQKRRQAEERIRQLEAELARLRQQMQKGQKP